MVGRSPSSAGLTIAGPDFLIPDPHPLVRPRRLVQHGRQEVVNSARTHAGHRRKVLARQLVPGRRLVMSHCWEHRQVGGRRGVQVTLMLAC